MIINLTGPNSLIGQNVYTCCRSRLIAALTIAGRRSDTIAHAECTVSQELDAGDHLVFIAQVEDGQPPAPGTKPLMYFRRTYGTWHE